MNFFKEHIFGILLWSIFASLLAAGVLYVGGQLFSSFGSSPKSKSEYAHFPASANGVDSSTSEATTARSGEKAAQSRHAKNKPSDQPSQSIGGSNIGGCNTNINGSDNSVNCNAKSEVERPGRAEALSQITHFNKSPIYEITNVKYNNGQVGTERDYVVYSEVDLRLNMSCKQLMSTAESMRNPSAGDMKAVLGQLAMGLSVIKFVALFGGQNGDCNIGDKYSLLLKDNFEDTENGWILVDQDLLEVDPVR